MQKKKDNPRVIGILSFRLLQFRNPELILHKLSLINIIPCFKEKIKGKQKKFNQKSAIAKLC